MKHIAALLFLLSAPVLAADKSSNTDLPPPPTPPSGYQGQGAPSGDEALEPEITITTRGTDRVEEYRYNGQLYMIKVTPKHGVPYYLIDEEGRGQFHRSDLQPDVKPPMWVLKRF
jgi:hypothetical protein